MQRRTKHWDGTATGRADQPSKPREVRPQAVEFREVRLVEPRKADTAPPSNAVLEVVLPSGITLRLPSGSSPDFLASVITTLEKS